MRHYVWADYGKVIAICSVVLLHTHCVAEVGCYINSYVMPLFFFISGFLFSFERNPAFRPFVKKRFRQLIVPYLWINAVAYLAWVMVLRNFGSNPDDTQPWHVPLVAVITGMPRWLIHDIPTWSLVSFFVVEILFYTLSRMSGRRSVAVMAFSVAMVAVMYYFMPAGSVRSLPLALAPSMMGVGFYALGHACSTLKRFKEDQSPWLLAAVAVVAGGIWIILASLNGETAFYIFDFGDLPLFYGAALAGVASFVSVSMLAGRLKEPALVRFISYGTLLICGFHLLMFAFIKGIALFVFGIPAECLTEGLPRGILFSVAALSLCLPVVYAIRRWTRFLIDK